MAPVYRARDVKHDRLVALKVLRPELSAALGAEQFHPETRTTARLAYPHILTHGGLAAPSTGQRAQ